VPDHCQNKKIELLTPELVEMESGYLSVSAMLSAQEYENSFKGQWQQTALQGK
jgi:hypothetical protein